MESGRAISASHPAWPRDCRVYLVGSFCLDRVTSAWLGFRLNDSSVPFYLEPFCFLCIRTAFQEAVSFTGGVSCKPIL